MVLDELALVRHGVRAALEADGFEIVGETHSVRDALAFAAAVPAELLVVGAAAGHDPCEVVRRAKALAVPPVILVLAPAGARGSIAALIAAGADAVLPRGVRPDELVSAAGRALAGEQVVAPVLQRSLVGAVAPVEAGVEHGGDHDAGLSAREREVLALLAAGRKNREIANELSLSLATVKSHLVHVYAKLGVRDRADAVHAAVVRGLLA